ncbi:MAG TPA: hypothetical protein VKX28_18855 [Xanthobacteraceae bacterium]|nr:hypothetical protein [Xanthobacteraceae bacterium]
MSGLIRATRQHARPAPARFTVSLLEIICRSAAAIRDGLQRSSQRRVLREWVEHNDRHLLRDIGMTRAEARREAAKWFWQR